MNEKIHCVYMMSNEHDGVLYVGASSNLVQRVYQHKTNAVPGFTQRYRVHRLVWFEVHGDARAMVARERQLKEWPRAWKVRLIESVNRRWHDLYGELLGGPSLTGPGGDPGLRRDDK